MTKFCIDSFLQAEVSRPKTAGPWEVWGSLWYIPSLPPASPVSLQLGFLHQHKRQNQAAKAPLPWYTNVTFGVEVMWQLPTTASPHPIWLPSWHSVLPSSTPLSKRRSVPPHLRHRVGGTSTYGYSVGRIPGIVRDNEGEQESDDEDLGGWWWI